MSVLEAILIAILQGVTELFPVSSLGHAVIVPALVGLSLDEKAPEFLPFLVVLHLGTSVALLAYFWRSWVGFAASVTGLGAGQKKAEDRRLFFLVCVGTVPAVILGFALEKFFHHLFSSPVIVSAMLALNGFLLFFGERLKKQAGEKTLVELNWRNALLIGAFQCLALIPGFSRSGATITGGILCGLKPDKAAQFSFLLATPVIIGAAVVELPKVYAQRAAFSGTALLAGLVAGVVAYASLVFLMRFFKNHETHSLTPFAYYCWGAGALSLVILLAR